MESKGRCGVREIVERKQNHEIHFADVVVVKVLKDILEVLKD